MLMTVKRLDFLIHTIEAPILITFIAGKYTVDEL
jgi:hypothetical protein